MPNPQSLDRPISPPPSKRRKSNPSEKNNKGIPSKSKRDLPSLAAIEAGEARIRDHLAYFTQHLSRVCKPQVPTQPRLSISEFARLYVRNQNTRGRHFVIHQHNHPVAGVHYDLRLQFSGTSTISFAIPYGVPGNANSKRQGRLGIETRVHNLWNNLIESASHATGSLLIWDTGVYSVLPRREKAVETDDEISDASEYEDGASSNLSASGKLIQAFQSKYIRLRLRGTRLPSNYTITLRLPSANDTVIPKSPGPVRKRRLKSAISTEQDSDSSDDSPALTNPTEDQESSAIANASENEDEAAHESHTIRANNAYTGATNTIGSIHQRHWFISLDRRNSGFKKTEKGWEPAGPGMGFHAFFVRGAEVETSVVSGRTSAEIMADEGVEGYRCRKKWRPVLE